MSGSFIDILIATIGGFAGVFFLAAFAVNYFAGKLGWPKRIAMGMAGILLIHPEITTSLVGIGIAVLVYFLQRATAKKTAVS